MLTENVSSNRKSHLELESWWMMSTFDIPNSLERSGTEEWHRAANKSCHPAAANVVTFKAPSHVQKTNLAMKFWDSLSDLPSYKFTLYPHGNHNSLFISVGEIHIFYAYIPSGRPKTKPSPIEVHCLVKPYLGWCKTIPKWLVDGLVYHWVYHINLNY